MTDNFGVLENQMLRDYRRSLGDNASLYEEEFAPLYERDNPRVYRNLGPGFLPQDIARRYQEDATRFVDLVASIPERIFGNDAGRIGDYLGVSTRDIELADLRPDDPSWRWIARPDFFEGPDGPRFLEVNIDSSQGGLGNVDRIASVVSQSESFMRLPIAYGCVSADPCSRLPGVIRRVHRNQRGRGEPTVAILDWREEIEEFPEPYRLLGGRLMADGINTVVGDERSLDFNGDRLTVGGVPVDVVFRGIVLDDVWRSRRGSLKPLEEAYESGKVGVLSNFRTYLFDNKKMQAILSDERHAERFTSEERKFIDRTLPWTRYVTERSTTRNGNNVDLVPHIRAHRDELTLKPGDGSGAMDVVVGRYHTESRWEGALSRALLEGNWVVQEYVEPPVAVFPRYEPDGVVEEKLAYLWGAYVVNNRPGGFVIRAGQTHKGTISGQSGAGVGCVFVCHSKAMGA